MEHLLTLQDWYSLEMLQEQKLTINQDFGTFPLNTGPSHF